jgi:hypothetical protein
LALSARISRRRSKWVTLYGPAAKTVRVRNGKRMVTDGPCAETKEPLGGYYLVEAKTADEAIAIRGQDPLGALSMSASSSIERTGRRRKFRHHWPGGLVPVCTDFVPPGCF